ncbi:MAG TPA: PQQ-binding-like beta-propeller repeat protein, partial [Phycisphaerae bacterium]|nr:PQQ-binding-like beta-propeller repeat protein [Phycisphaerae bacterium]
MFRTISIIALLATAQFTFAGDSAARNWPAFRGPLATGEAPNAKPPTTWSEDSNINWKVAIPGRGHATPIIWGDRIYIQTAVETDKDAPAADSDDAKKSDDESPPPPRRRRGNRPNRPEGERSDDSPSIADQPDEGNRPPPPPDGEGRRRGPRGGPGGRGFGPKPPPKHLFDFEVIALDRKTGKTIWTTTVKEVRPHEGGHGDASQASNSPVTDGENIYAYFGSRGLHCLSRDGKVKWSVDLGQMKTRMGFGEGSSPALYGDTIVIDWDHEGDDFIVAIDKHTGKEKWRKSRDEHTTWATPLIVEADGKPEVVVSA